MTAPRFFATTADFRRWLERHAASEPELLVGFHKVDSGKPSMTWPESAGALRLYDSLVFAIVGTLPGAFRHAQLGFVDTLVLFRAFPHSIQGRGA